MNPKLQKVMTKYLLSDSERDATQADFNRLIALRDNAHKALKDTSLNCAQRESFKQGLACARGQSQNTK